VVLGGILEGEEADFKCLKGGNLQEKIQKSGILRKYIWLLKNSITNNPGKTNPPKSRP
jgi:hypothetical protein